MKDVLGDPMFWRRMAFGLWWAMLSMGSGMFLILLTPSAFGMHVWGPGLVGFFTTAVVQPAVHAEFDRRHRDTP